MARPVVESAGGRGRGSGGSGMAAGISWPSLAPKCVKLVCP